MSRVFLVAVVAVAACGRSAPPLGHLKTDRREFHFEHDIQLFSAKNGLTVALLRDPRSNLVTVDVRYPVGAAEDPEGRAGMAHLVEHTSFLVRADASGPTIWDRAVEATLYANAYTNSDETHYTQIGFPKHLDEMLAIEALRMSASCDRIDQTLFERERDVVLQETAQTSSSYDRIIAELDVAVWGKEHPYTHGVGTREIADATREEACAFMAAHYGPDHAIVVITGDIDEDAVGTALARAFGPIAKRDLPDRKPLPAVTLDGETSRHQADIEDATAIVYFEAPAWGSLDYARFTTALAYYGADLSEADADEEWITGTGYALAGAKRERALAVYVSVDDAARLDDAVDLVFDKAAALARRIRFLELNIVKRELMAGMVAGYDSLETRGAWLADYLQYTDHGRFFLMDMAMLANMKIADFTGWPGEHMTRSFSHIALVEPSGSEESDESLTITEPAPEREVPTWRSAVDAAEANQVLAADAAHVESELVDYELANGLRVLLAPDPKNPRVEARLVYPVGTSADPDDRPGLAYATAFLIEPDTDIDDRAAINKINWGLHVGTLISFDVEEQSTTFSASGLAMFADWHVWRLFWTLDHSTFPKQAIQRMHARAAKAGDPEQDVASSALRAKLFGSGHPYAGAPLTAADVQRIGGADCERFRGRHYKARDATLVVAGGFDVEAMRQEIDDLFGTWDRKAPAAIAEVPAIAPVAGPSWIGITRSHARQVAVTIAFAAGSDRQSQAPERRVLQALVEERMRVVREQLAASYGMQVYFMGGEAGGALVIEGLVDPDRAAEAVTTIRAELARLNDPDTDLAEDFVRARRRAMARALAHVGGVDATANELALVAALGVGVDHFAELADRIGATTLEDLRTLIRTDLDADREVIELAGRKKALDSIFEAAGVTPEMLED